jgi:hypothetical protein
MDLTYREKRIWISLSTQLLVYLVYFVELHRGVINLFLFLHVLLLMIVLQIVLQTMLALTARQEPKDERDLAIERVAYRNAYLVLVSTLITLLAAATVSVHIRSMQHWHAGAFSVMNHVIFLLFLAEITKLASQLVLYRRAA